MYIYSRTIPQTRVVGGLGKVEKQPDSFLNNQMMRGLVAYLLADQKHDVVEQVPKFPTAFTS